MVIGGTAFTEQSSTVRAQPLQGSVENAYRYQFEITDDIETSDILATVTIRDISQNVATIELEGWAIDSQDPVLEVYAPSQESLYLYGEQIHVYGAVTDDVGIASVEVQFRYYQNGNHEGNRLDSHDRFDHPLDEQQHRGLRMVGAGRNFP